ncbi:SLAP domain-containing protein [Sporosarcina sp. ANT_H38]|uniref:SLAP domain-containing protein n=1 Tax=Sporosarcina sp. ANT_H38 TaxID=2597358 RepID=UPI0011F1F1BA|nr:SLAP domain-containing protein [Sporosarcina sp. ANT_H38]KAA0944245.1 SLAP domain-containing protein [Sporosarcina sp. ANT_H38]
MQRLYFESAWDKTIAPIDREKIMYHFQQQTKQLQDGVHLSFFRKARNHKGEQLITVLIHNFEDINFRLHNTVISYYEQDKQLANAAFSLPCEIAGNTSMPWTFIFSETNETTADPQYSIWN